MISANFFNLASTGNPTRHVLPQASPLQCTVSEGQGMGCPTWHASPPLRLCGGRRPCESSPYPSNFAGSWMTQTASKRAHSTLPHTYTYSTCLNSSGPSVCWSQVAEKASSSFATKKYWDRTAWRAAARVVIRPDFPRRQVHLGGRRSGDVM